MLTVQRISSRKRILELETELAAVRSELEALKTSGIMNHAASVIGRVESQHRALSSAIYKFFKLNGFRLPGFGDISSLEDWLIELAADAKKKK